MSDRQREVLVVLARSARRHPDEIGLDMDLFMELGIDSLEGLKLLAILERKYGVTLPDHELLQLNTPRRILEALERNAPESAP